MAVDPGVRRAVRSYPYTVQDGMSTTRRRAPGDVPSGYSYLKGDDPNGPPPPTAGGSDDAAAQRQFAVLALTCFIDVTTASVRPPPSCPLPLPHHRHPPTHPHARAPLHATPLPALTRYLPPRLPRFSKDAAKGGSTPPHLNDQPI